MRRPLFSLLAAIGFFLLGGMLVSPFTPAGKRISVGPNGERVVRPRTEAEIRADNFRVLCAEAPAYASFAAGAVSFGWTLFLVSWGVASIIRARKQQHENGD